MEQLNVSETQHLCLSCGFCCQGILFSRVDLKGGEVEILEDLQLPLIEFRGSKILRQPCAAHDDGQCGIYDHRPSPCRKYECGLLKDVHNGTRTYEQASQIIRQAVELLDSLYAAMGYRDRTKMVWDQVEEFTGIGDGSIANDPRWREHAQLLLNSKVLQRICEKYFKPPWNKKSSDPGTIQVETTTIG